ncbi:MAG: hypothetical protein ACRDMX_18275 [Solirubrobacteraceae bacterium]
MSSESVTATTVRRRPTAVLVLGVLGLLTFALIPVRVNTIYGGLPAHPLFLHVPVILIPVAGIAALLLAVRPALFDRHGVWVVAVTIAALASTNLTVASGKALKADLFGGVAGRLVGTRGQVGLILRHEHAADILRLLTIAFTAAMIVALALWRAGGQRDVTANAMLDGLLARVRAPMPRLIPMRLAIAALALACLYFVFHTGDLGARAVWQGRVSSGARLHQLGFGAPKPGGSLFPPGVHPPGAPPGS